MPVDDADRLGPKGHVYVELVREQWRAPLERGSARRALLTSFLGAALIIFGTIFALEVYGESILLIGIGLFAFVSSLGEIRALAPEFSEARRIGWVEASLDDNSVTIGEPAILRVVLHARRKLTLRGATALAEARHWDRATAGEVVSSIPLPISVAGESVGTGDDWRHALTFRIPETAPTSVYTSIDSTRWTLTLELTFAEGGPWRRTWPMLVFPADVS